MNFTEQIKDTMRGLKERYQYRELVKITGIEQTRLFRIMNGSEIKLNEVQILIDKKIITVEYFYRGEEA